MVKFQKFRIGDLFTAESGDTDLKKVDIENNGVPVITSGVQNYGILGLTTKKAKVIPQNTITVDMFGNVYFRDFEYKMVTHARVFSLIPKQNITRSIGLYFQTCLSKHKSKFSYDNMCVFTKLENETIELPIDDAGKLDVEFIENYIRQLEADCLQQLEAYLIATGLDDYVLNDKDKDTLSLSQINITDEVRYSNNVVDEQLRFKEFKLASSYFKNGKEVKVSTDGIFNITPTKKKINANTISFGGRYPYVARGESQNGIRGYINFDENYLNPEKTISFGQDTATMFYQPKAYFTGDKIQVFSLNSKHGELNEKIATYLITAVRKALVNFAWGQSSFALEVISELNVMLPVDKYARLNLNYMENYIRAIEKLTIKDVVEYKDKMIALTKKNI
ncbi:restriction endonuclease subunit S [Ligilactobacillus salivarius]|uniref:restriction endonuclease subunit S n=2 Tax=Ligilactobacillus salivarius TaxID=1624 RepID=UPI0013703581|nr:restriction endonuclease subunit S [Ligilactobacillus salivarius]MYU68632.1 restriction endonuclease subunit S [Ligilactobacillus salivarius]MYV15662.1 restriction endonuclease subunit S [Ligilactobacillus salivarius]MYY23044.1 restriction endonuclease subunit S [Ligilactobacillus salivarius]MYY40518.1 restriction endonuclease subunit S [Ligilactobacillus salivarius]